MLYLYIYVHIYIYVCLYVFVSPIYHRGMSPIYHRAMSSIGGTGTRDVYYRFEIIGIFEGGPFQRELSIPRISSSVK